MKQVSIVVSTLNRGANIEELIKSLDYYLNLHKIAYEIIFIDDYSKDDTYKIINKLSAKYPVSVFLKKGKKAEKSSLLEGFRKSKYANIAIIGASLKYPAAEIIPMLDKIYEGADIVVANRLNQERSSPRRVAKKIFSLLLVRWLHNLNVDFNSGLKIFKRQVLEEVRINPRRWVFPLEFLVKARKYGYSISGHDITLFERNDDSNKNTPFWKEIFKTGLEVIMFKFEKISPFHIKSKEVGGMKGAGVAHNEGRFITHTSLHHSFSAINTFHFWQKTFLVLLGVFFVLGMIKNPLSVGIVFIGILSFIYFADTLFGLFLVIRSLDKSPEIKSTKEEIAEIDDEDLPVYTIFCPLYKESIVLPSFVKSIGKLDWPKEKLDVLLLLEEDDKETINKARDMNLPGYFRIIVVPHSMPKTKPKACNYGLAYASGEYAVIYDAEDDPDYLQLKKAYLGFKKTPSNVRCLQAKLNYYNSKQNLLTRLFTAEYSLWFDVNLPGLQSIETTIPLGGTSNHFYTKDLIEFQGWDPFNVTEDCDLGVRIFNRGYKTAIIDSITLEEANSDLGNWLRQRSRWIKGYMQTYLVHMRNPLAFFKKNGRHAFVFQLIVGGKIAFMLINPVLWILTLLYFVFRSTALGATIEALYPPTIFYMAATSLVMGNFLYIYYYMIGCAKRGHWELIKYVFFIPLYWIAVSVAAAIAIYQLFFKPHYWEKTEHGLHLAKADNDDSGGGKKTDSIDNGDKKEIIKPRLIGYIFLEDGWQKIKDLLLGISKLQEFIPSSLRRRLFSSKGFLISAIIVSSAINFLFNVFLVRVLSYSQLAVVVLINTFWYIITILTSGLSDTVNSQVSYLVAKKGVKAGNVFFKWMLNESFIIAAIFTLSWLIAIPKVASFFQIQETSVLIFFTPIFISGLLVYAYDGFFKGSFLFFFSAWMIFSEAISKMLIAFVLNYIGRDDLIYLSIPLSLMASGLLGIFLFHNVKSGKSTYKEDRYKKFPSKFFVSAVIASLYPVLFLSLDILVVKHFFSEDVAGRYSILSLAGKIIYFLGTLPLVFMIPYVSRNEGLGKNSKAVFDNLFIATIVLTLLGLILFGFLGFLTVPLLFGAKAIETVGLLPVYSTAIAMFTLASTIIVYHLAKRQYIFSWISVLSSIIFLLAVWSFHDSIAQVVTLLLIVSSINLLAISLLHYFEKDLVFVNRGVFDFFGIFTSKLPKTSLKEKPKKKILIFNWRDVNHLYAGGAENYIHQISKILVSKGNQVTIFCGNDGTQRNHDNIEGIDIVRRGGFYLVYIWAFFYYIFRFRGKYDVIIDCQNGIPFFTPIYAKEPVYCLMHHVHQKVFFRHLIKPLAIFASFLEKDLMPLVYRKIKFITVSKSSKEEMEEIGLGKAGIEIIYNGVDLNEFIVGEKSPRPTVMYLGRLRSYKSVDVLLRAFGGVLSRVPNAQLIIAGSGDDEDNLKNIAKELGLNNEQVVFKGRVPDKERVLLMQKAWVLVNPSLMEGFGVVIIEANACGTPVIASNVPGLRDAVKNMKSGCLVKYGDVAGFAEEILKIFENKKLLKARSKSSRAWAENFPWEKSSLEFISFIEDN